jgi:hypothetical protein
MNWYKILTVGQHYDGPRGPYRSRDDAETALAVWRERKGCLAGSIEAASSLRITGPYPTRAVARDADISESVEQTIRRHSRP